MFMLLLLVLLNIGISYWNAKQAGKVWAESKGVGGWLRILVWCAVIQSAVGFTSAYAIILATLAMQFNYLPPQAIQLMMNLTYVLIIIPALGSGFAITIHSWIAFAREKSLANLGMAGWNTFAQAYNTYNAVQNFGAAFSNVSESLGELFSGDSDGDDASTMRVLMLVAIALLGGVLTTAALVQKYAASLPVSEAVRRGSCRDIQYR